MKRAGRVDSAALIAAALVIGVGMSGCSSSGSSSALGTDASSFFDRLGFGAKPKTSGTTGAEAANPDQQEFDCPNIEIRQGASTLTVAAKDSEANAADLRYQGSIVRTARECPLRDGIVNLRVGVEGRIVLGPLGGPGEITVPLRMAVVHEGPEPKTILTKLYQIPVTIPPNEGRVNFTKIADDMGFPMPKPPGLIDEYVIYVGFDQMPPSEPKAKKPPPQRQRRKG